VENTVHFVGLIRLRAESRFEPRFDYQAHVHVGRLAVCTFFLAVVVYVSINIFYRPEQPDNGNDNDVPFFCYLPAPCAGPLGSKNRSTSFACTTISSTSMVLLELCAITHGRCLRLARPIKNCFFFLHTCTVDSSEPHPCSENNKLSRNLFETFNIREERGFKF